MMFLRNVFMITIIALLTFSITTETYADVFAHNIRFTQPDSHAPFDGSFEDGTGAAIRFTLSDYADSVVVNVYFVGDGNPLVKTLRAQNYTSGDTLVLWDGTNSSGEPVSSGNYRFEIVTYNQGYTDYTLLAQYDYSIYTRGVTTIKNQNVNNFGFIYTADAGGYASGAARHANNGMSWGDAPGVPLYTTTGDAPIGPDNLRYSSESDDDGFIYVARRSNSVPGIYRYHADSTVVTLIDSGGYNAAGRGWPQGIAVTGTGTDKTLIISDHLGVVYGFEIGNANTYFGTKHVVLRDTTVRFLDMVVGRNNILYATYYYLGDAGKPGVAKFDLTTFNFGDPHKTLADAVWKAEADSGRATTCSIWFGDDPSGADDLLYFVIARRAGGDLATQGIFVISGLNAAQPNVELAFQDPNNNATEFRSDIAVDAVGNIVYFENSNEYVIVIAPPLGPNNFNYSPNQVMRVFASEPIADVRIDANGDGQPDRIGETVTVQGMINSVNFVRLSNRFSYSIQDQTGGIVITKGSMPGGGPVFEIGDRVLVTGNISYFRGTTQLEIDDIDNDLVLIDQGNTVTPITLYIDEYLENGEYYESRLMRINYVKKTETSQAWPPVGQDANSFTITDGYRNLIMRISRNTDLGENPEPTYPMNVVGVATQFTSSSTVHLDGYQLSPNSYSNITQGVAAPPSPYFFMAEPADGSIITLTDSSQTFTAKWTSTVDLNNDPIIYQFVLLKTPVFQSAALSDTTYTFSAANVLNWMAGNDTLVTRWTVRAKGAEAAIIPSIDTFAITFVNALPTSVDDNFVPKKFFVEQNYPNPFNPTTNIKFGIPTEQMVDLRIYNILGQEVAVLVNNEIKSAGTYTYAFDATKLSTGTYIYRIQTGENVVSKKMLLIK